MGDRDRLCRLLNGLHREWSAVNTGDADGSSAIPETPGPLEALEGVWNLSRTGVLRVFAARGVRRGVVTRRAAGELRPLLRPPEPCFAAETLFGAWRESVGRYAELTSQLHGMADMLDGPERDRLRREADEELLQARRLYAALNAHRGVCGC